MSSRSFLLFFAAACCISFVSCAGKQYIPISQVHTESSVLTVHDTVFQDRILTKTVRETVVETVRQHDSISIVVDSAGSVKRTDNWHSIIIEREDQTVSDLRDSVYFLRSMYEAMLKQRNDSVDRPVFIEKKQSFFCRLKNRLATGIVIVCIIGFAIWRIHRRK